MNQSKSFPLTKSRFVKGKNCPKAVYLYTYSPEIQTPLTPSEEKNIEAGNEVGQKARQYFPDGLLIESLDIEKALLETQNAISNNVLTLYEPAFRFENTVMRVDILTRKEPDAPWDLYEVKSTTYNNSSKEQKEEYRNDIGFQVWVLQQLNIPLGKISLMHLNGDCTYPNLENLFIYEDYSKEILPVLSNIENNLSDLKKTLIKAQEPDCTIGAFCDKPRACSFKEYCWKDIPKPSLFNIPNCIKKWKLYEKGLVSINALSPNDFTSDVHKKVLECYKNNNHYFDQEIVIDILNTYKYPLIFLDFESIDYPIPKHSNTHPYQHIPFQFSCHIQQEKEFVINHHEFIFDSKEDPRKAFIKSLIKIIPDEGSIIVYYKPYEETRLKELAEAFPEHREALINMINRLVDLMVIIQKGVYYPEFLGSFSIKKVAPAILGNKASYANLEIGNGVQAMLAYKKLIQLPPNSKEKEALKNAMLEYCKQDTYLMVLLHEWLKNEISK